MYLKESYIDSDIKISLIIYERISPTRETRKINIILIELVEEI